jgi:oligosaccharyltransferase complex subunit alpha (ribophorin I)
MNNEEERILIIREDYFGKLQMLPKKITIKEDQLVLFEDTQNIFSLYKTLEQELEIKLPSDKTRVIEYSEDNALKSKDKIVYSLNFAVEPLKLISLRIHYENNDPLMVFNYGYKSFEVSHWGNIAVEERYQIENIGAKLDGEFGRVDFDDRGRNGGKNAFKKLESKLPLRSNGLWYRDEIGNISTSRASRTVNFQLN